MKRFRQPAEPPGPTGWLIGVLVTAPGEARPRRHFYAVAEPERARAEWAAVDCALAAGEVASSPAEGLEPVQAVGALPSHRLAAHSLGGGQIRALGPKWPRSWLMR